VEWRDLARLWVAAIATTSAHTSAQHFMERAVRFARSLTLNILECREIAELTMLKMGYFDPVERRREKSLARAADDAALRSGVSREDLRVRNSFLAPLEIVGSSAEHQSAHL
jgi:hypothetical protein